MTQQSTRGTQRTGGLATEKLIIDGVEVTASAAEINAVADVAQADAIDDLSLTGTYATDDDAIEAAINDILAVLRARGMIAESG